MHLRLAVPPVRIAVGVLEFLQDHGRCPSIGATADIASLRQSDDARDLIVVPLHPTSSPTGNFHPHSALLPVFLFAVARRLRDAAYWCLPAQVFCFRTTDTFRGSSAWSFTSPSLLPAPSVVLPFSPLFVHRFTPIALFTLRLRRVLGDEREVLSGAEMEPSGARARRRYV